MTDRIVDHNLDQQDKAQQATADALQTSRQSAAREWLIWATAGCVLLGTAGMLAASAVPEAGSGPHRDAPPAKVVPPTQTAPTASPIEAKREAAPDAIRGTLKPEVQKSVASTVPYGPPERVKTVAERAIAPLLSADGADADLAAVKSALANVSARRIPDALATARRIKTPGGRKLVQWVAFRQINSGVSARTIEDFRIANPSWPENKLLRQRAEEALLLNNTRARDVKAFFADAEPQYAAGHAALAVAELTEGNTDTARKRARMAWRMGNFGATVEARILTRLKEVIDQSDIRWRLDQHMLDDGRYGRTARLAVIRRMIRLLKPEAASDAKARLKVWRSYRSRSRRRLTAARNAIATVEKRRAAIRAAANINLPVRKPEKSADEIKNAPDTTKEETSGTVEPTIAAANPPSPKPDQAPVKTQSEDTVDWPYEYHRIQLLRRGGQHKAAWQRLLDAPSDTEKLVAPDHWWEERRVNIFNALYAKSYQTAYRLAAMPGSLGENARNQASFMAGWIAFRFLGDLEKAREHFHAFTKTADGPRTRGQSHYWLGRLYDVMGDAEASNQNYRTAAREFQTFYGQLARQKLEPDAITLDIPALPELTPKRIAETQASDVLQALRFARLSGNSTITRRLLRAIGKSKQDPHVYQLAAEFAKSTGDTQMAVRIGKGALFHGVPLVDHAYPTHAFPLFKPLLTPPEPAMLYGLARQESEFNTLVKSIVGARGVLQVMPATAHGVCREHRLRCGSRRALTRRLSRDPSYNATLASAYVSGRLQEFGGSYILTYAGYNAGPGRARYWISKNGDPRDPTVDPIDWIELIHLEETREYVKKVMANLQIYRARLGKPETALQITKDVTRGTF